MWYMSMMEYYSAIKKKKTKKQGNLALCDNMQEPGEYYAERNKPDIEK